MSEIPTSLSERHCVAYEKGALALSLSEAEDLVNLLSSKWELNSEAAKLEGRFSFQDYARTLAFVNAVAYIAIKEDHHPDISFGFNSAFIVFTTHSVHGLSENDFITAAKVDALTS